VVGHSLGEVAAAHVAGALDLDEAARLVCCRSRLLRRLAGRGAMALVDRSAEQTRVLLDGYADRLEVAVLNGPRGTVVAGEPTTLSSWLASIEGRGVFCRRLNVDVAAHTRQVDALERCLREELAGLDGRPAAVPVYSTVLGEPIEGGRLDAAYWFANARQPVRFQRAVERASADGYGVFLELSPQPTLTHAIEDTLGATGQSGVVVGSCRRGAAAEALLEASCALWADGAALDWSCRFPPGRRLVDLPAYPWQRQRHWVERPRRWTPAPGAGEPPAVLPAPPAASVRPESDRHDVDALVRDCAARVLRVRPDALAQDVPLAALGLDSLMCLELRRRLQSAVGASPSLAALAMGSVAAIAAELRGAAAKRGTAERSELRHQVVPLRPIGPRATRPPLFFCAPIFGVAYPYLALAAHLGDDQPFYVLQPPGMDGGAPAESIEALAEAHVRALRGVHPEGPCYVGGWSFGALVAYELACQLAEAGRPPDAVALVDALAPTGHPSGWRFFWYLLEQGAPGTFVHLGRYTRLRWTGRGSGREARGADASAVPGVRELLGVCFAGFRAGRRYEPRAYAGRVALLRTARTPPADAHGRDDGSWGWARLAQRGVDVREVPGGHIDVIRAPHVAVLAARLRGVLDGAPTWLGASTPAVGPTPSAP
jgi:thioesterase domain-containing protein/aryl carrier-like protein